MKELIEYIAARSEALQPNARFMLGVVGSPGAGKSTFSQQLVSELNAYCEAPIAVVVPMDGFHLPNKVLDERNLRALKGIPETFDSEAFVAMLAELREVPARRVGCPTFDRSLDEPTADGLIVEPKDRVLIVEGNYLLMQEHPWKCVGELLDEIWFLDVDIETIVPRLVERHIAGGRDEAAAKVKTEETDLRNAKLIAQTKQFADRILQFRPEGCFV